MLNKYSMSQNKNSAALSFLDDVWGVDRFFGDFRSEPKPLVDYTPKIKVNLVEHDNEYVITADVPGVPKENISARFDNVRDMITITTVTSCEREREDENTGKVHLSERFYGSSSRSVPLRRGTADYNNVVADYENGVVTIKVKKLSEEQRIANSRNIKIN